MTNKAATRSRYNSTMGIICKEGDMMENLKPGEVEITQYLMPDGRKRKLKAYVGEELARLAQDMELSTEVLTTGEVAIYAKRGGEEMMDLANNGPGDNSPKTVLARLIERAANRANALGGAA